MGRCYIVLCILKQYEVDVATLISNSIHHFMLQQGGTNIDHRKRLEFLSLITSLCATNGYHIFLQRLPLIPFRVTTNGDMSQVHLSLHIFTCILVAPSSLSSHPHHAHAPPFRSTALDCWSNYEKLLFVQKRS
ncbi:hypothetical protein VNO80_30493 [Phaseolus coccineus]|uniref:Uncharacterized protein n=1 Tax=Phaseolus coccineus TaxID=3886 RepID=A0AAN9LDZ7_PHACN